MNRTLAIALVVSAAALALGACGNTRGLTPKLGHSLPPAPYGLGYQPEADDLLKKPVQAAPQRNVELRTRSQERTDDPFDLPPSH